MVTVTRKNIQIIITKVKMLTDGVLTKIKKITSRKGKNIPSGDNSFVKK